MAGTIVVDRLESDASYASSINIASPVIVSNTTTFRSNSTISTTTAESLRLHRSGSSSQISSVVMEDGGSSVGTANTVRLSTSLGALSISTGGTGGSSTGGTEYARVEANGVFNLVSGQLRFPATQNASSDANTLDDYEEGTWTPALMTGSSQPTFTYTNRGGTYVKIGRQVIAWFYALVSVSSAGSAQAAVVASSLPFAPRSNSLTDSSSSRGGFVVQNPQSLNNTVLTWNSANPSTADVLYFTTLTGGSTTSGLASGTYAGYVIYEAN
jgi:hypothetical protein